MDMTNSQIEHEWRRQIYLCAGLGQQRQREILSEAWREGTEYYPCRECGKRGSFFRGHLCQPMPPDPQQEDD